MTDNLHITWKSWFMVAALGLTWGGTFMVTEVALTGITPFWLAAGRIGFAAILMTVIWRALGGKLFAAPLPQGLLFRSQRLAASVPQSLSCSWPGASNM